MELVDPGVVEVLAFARAGRRWRLTGTARGEPATELLLPCPVRVRAASLLGRRGH